MYGVDKKLTRIVKEQATIALRYQPESTPYLVLRLNVGVKRTQVLALKSFLKTRYDYVYM